MEKSLQGFKPITIKFSSDSNEKTMFMKEHSIRNQEKDKPAGRTLYLLNIPPWANEKSILKTFNEHSPVDTVTFTKFKDTTNTGFKCAYVVFKTDKALYKALNIRRLSPISTDSEPVLMGFRKYLQTYNDGLLNQHNREQEMIDIIKAYDAEETQKNAKEKNQTDDDGWTVVTKKGRNPGLSRKESVAEKLMAKTKKEKVLKNFYRHQIRQAKKDQLATLRKKAEEDKKKILALKQRRAFKPF